MLMVSGTCVEQIKENCMSRSLYVHYDLEKRVRKGKQSPSESKCQFLVDGGNFTRPFLEETTPAPPSHDHSMAVVLRLRLVFLHCSALPSFYPSVESLFDRP